MYEIKEHGVSVKCFKIEWLLYIIIYLLIYRALCKLVKYQPKDWDRHLDTIMFGLRKKVKMTTKYSPFF